jgi:two-component system cell cycle sensor histidine kinase/response regulator CckA
MTAALRVLIVEDVATDAKLIVHELRHTNRTIAFERVEDAPAMRAALENGPWDLITCDWSMPRFNARGALDVVKQMGIDLPFIIVSGTIGEETAVEAMRAGAHDYVLKDKLTRLAPAVEREIRESKTRDARRRAEKALLESEMRYRRIVETTSEGVWLIDAEAKTTFMNARMAEMLGCDVDHVAGLSPIEFLDEDGVVVLAESIQASKAGVSKQVEVQYKRRNGTTFWALLEASPILDAAGRFDGALAMVRDISERRKTQEDLRASEFRFRRLWDSGLILISISDTLGNISDVNEAGARMLGYSRAELLAGNVHWQEITPPEWKQADQAALVQLRTTGVAAPWEKELCRKDGSRVPILAGAAMLAGSERISIAIDLTERKRAENANFERTRIASLTAEVGVAFTQGGLLQETLQRCVAAIVEYLGAAFAGIWTFNPEGKALELQASDGPRAGIPVGKFQTDFILKERKPHVTNDVLDDPRINDPAWAKREGMVAFAGHPLLVGGELVGVVAMFARQPLTDAVLRGMGSIADEIAIGVHRSLGERIRGALEDQLRQAQKMEAVGRLAGGVAHDFNNVLSVILCYAEMMFGALKPGDPMRGDVEEVQKAGKRAADLTRQLLMFSRQQVLEPKVLDLNEVLSSMHKMLERILGADVEMVSLAGQGLGRVRADPSSIEQVIMNLVVNARDAMPTGGKLTIETTNTDLDDDFARQHVGVKAGPYVMLTVSDSGIGMNAATQARIFEPFFTTKPKEKGTGLGLSTVFGIAQQSGGGVWVYSELGKGTTFKIYLPRVDERIDTARPPVALAALRGSETILLVEDDDQVRLVALGILRRHGYQVIEARHAGEALLYCEQHAGIIHLLLTDVVMPQMSGPELAKRLAKDRPTMRVICMSGYTDDSIVRHGVLEAEIAYLQKPITPQTLTRKVRDVLDSAIFARLVPVGAIVRREAASNV